MKTAVIAVTESARFTAEIITAALPGCKLIYEREKGWLKINTGRLFKDYDGLIFIMATGIVVRMIAPYIDSKYEDPAVVVVDDARRFAISLLSGHEGGANTLAARVSTVLNAVPVITTASDTNKDIIIGVGCRRGTAASKIRAAAEAVLGAYKLDWNDIRAAATIDLKRDEQGITDCFAEFGIPVRYYSTDEINNFHGPYAESAASMKNIGVRAVAEPCALMEGRNSTLIAEKQILGSVTIALTKEDMK